VPTERIDSTVDKQTDFEKRCVLSVLIRHCFLPDPDPTFYFEADPDQDTDPEPNPSSSYTAHSYDNIFV
jgi:hypothetical protein